MIDSSPVVISDDQRWEAVMPYYQHIWSDEFLGQGMMLAGCNQQHPFGFGWIRESCVPFPAVEV